MAERSIDSLSHALMRFLPFFYGWIVISIAFVTMGIGVNARTSFSLLYPEILSEFLWSRADTALIFSIGFVVSAICTPFVGLLMGMLGPKYSMPIGAILMALGLILATFASVIWQFYLTLGVLVIGGSIFVSYTGHSMFLANWFQRKRGLAIGIAFSGVGCVGFLMFLWVQHLITLTSWRASCWAMAILLITIVIPINFFLQRSRPEELGLAPDGDPLVPFNGKEKLPRQVAIDHSWVETEWTVILAIKTGRFWWLALTIGTGLFVWYAVQVHQSQFLKQSGYTDNEVALALGVVVMSGVIGQIGLGHLSDRVGREWAWTFSLSGYVICYAILLIMDSYPSTSLMYMMAAVQGILGYGLASMFGAIPADLFQGITFPAILGVLSIVANLGAGMGPWVAGYIYDTTGSYNLAWFLSILVSVISIISVWIVAPRKVRLVAGKIVKQC